MIGQRFIEVVARIPPHRQIVPGLLHQLALGANTFEKHHQLELEEDDGIDGRTTAAGVAIGGEIADKRKIKDAMKVPIEVILRHIGFDRDEDGTVEVPRLRWPENRTPPVMLQTPLLP